MVETKESHQLNPLGVQEQELQPVSHQANLTSSCPRTHESLAKGGRRLSSLLGAGKLPVQDQNPASPSNLQDTFKARSHQPQQRENKAQSWLNRFYTGEILPSFQTSYWICGGLDIPGVLYPKADCVLELTCRHVRPFGLSEEVGCGHLFLLLDVRGRSCTFPLLPALALCILLLAGA